MKVIITSSQPTSEKREATAKAVAEFLGIERGDILILSDCTIDIINTPTATKATKSTISVQHSLKGDEK